ncbi:MAG: hypothetical protein OYH77_02865, partial [Pseudomonadota bacterium]|nr:hypothetical protein [Pseudomonadota bacterium]
MASKLACPLSVLKFPSAPPPYRLKTYAGLNQEQIFSFSRALEAKIIFPDSDKYQHMSCGQAKHVLIQHLYSRK